MTKVKLPTRQLGRAGYTPLNV